MTTPRTDILNHPELYFDDGNIVLTSIATGDKQKWGYFKLNVSHSSEVLGMEAFQLEVRFRVHKSILSIHSGVLKDMFLLPQGNEKLRIGDNEPEVEMVKMPDSADKIEAMLLLIYGRGMFKWSISKEVDRDRLSVWDCLLEMVHKYDMTEVATEIALDLRFQWPPTLREWDLLISARKAVHAYRDPVEKYRISYPEPAVALAFCQRFNLNAKNRIVPLYALSTIPANQKWDGERGARWHLLNIDDYRDLTLVNDFHKALCQMSFLETVQHCLGRSQRSPETCDLEACKAILTRGALQSGDVLEFLRMKVVEVNAGENLPEMCRQCSIYNRKRMEQERSRFWSDVLVSYNKNV